MANPTGFLQYPRVEIEHRPIEERIRDSAPDRPRSARRDAQYAGGSLPWIAASRFATASAVCCGIAFRSSQRWSTGIAEAEAGPRTCTRRTRTTPVTGRVCPPRARPPARSRLSTRGGEHLDCGSRSRWHVSRRLDRADSPTRRKPARKVAVVGSGPAGFTASPANLPGRGTTLSSSGPRSDRLGGLLRYGIPISSWKSRCSTIDENKDDVREIEFEMKRQRRRRYLARPPPAAASTQLGCAGGRPTAGNRTSPGATCPTSILRWIICRSRTTAWPATPSIPPRSSMPANSASL